MVQNLRKVNKTAYILCLIIEKAVFKMQIINSHKAL